MTFVDDDDECPVCGGLLDFDEVDIGVGVQRGNYGCPDCGWTPGDRTTTFVDNNEDEEESDPEDDDRMWGDD